MEFWVHILGSNSAIPAYNRNHTAQVVHADNRYYLVDCGEGTQLQLYKNRIKLNKISAIFISHLHGDHYLGLMGVISSMHLLGREKELDVYGPKGLAEIITVQLKYSESVLSYKLNFHEIDTFTNTTIFDKGHLTVDTIPLEHRINCCGFLFREKKRKRRLIKSKLPEGITILQMNALRDSEDVLDDTGELLYKYEDYTLPPHRQRAYAYCSDTKKNELVTELVHGVDLLYHEATFLKELENRAENTFHSTTVDAADVAKKANVKKLIIGHFSSRYKDINPFLDEAVEVFKNTQLATEGTRFMIEL